MKRNSKILVLGGDGFCGWPTSLRLSKKYDVIIVDNLSRRKIDVDLGCSSLTPIETISKRINAWKEISGKKISFEHIDLSTEYERLLALIKKTKPHAIVHFAEQRAAPYSMKSSYHKRYTVNNNVNVTNNVLAAIVESGLDIHLVHLGTMGYYGYSDIGMEIPEGYLKVKVKTGGKEKSLEIMYPPSPGSIYHMTKVLDAMMLSYYNKNDNIRVTDLHQGIVWGTQTEETETDERLINRFDYDGDYGTVLNRFLMQSAVGHPITVHGVGGQTRGFIHIKDTVKCVKIAIENPPKKNERVKVFNQTAETLNVGDLAKKIKRMTGTEIRYYNNPRKEAPKNDLRVSKKGFVNLGWKPITLEEGLLNEVKDIAEKYKYRCDKSKIISTSTWTKDIKVDYKGKTGR